MTFGESLSKIRQERKMSQDELAERLKISAQTVRRWEYDKTKPSIDELSALCEIFGVSANYFLSPDAESAMIEESAIAAAESTQAESAQSESAQEESKPKSLHKKRNIIIVSIALCLASVGLILSIALPYLLLIQRDEEEIEKIYTSTLDWTSLLCIVVMLIVITICVILLVKFLKPNKGDINNEKK